MFVPFESLPPTSRIWIYQADRALNAAELKIAEEKLREFTEAWTVHGAPLETSFSLRFNHFIILAANDSHQNASGCSIDSSVRVLKEIEQLLGIGLFDRNKIAFVAGDQDVFLVPLHELKQKFRDGILNAHTLTFNNLVNTKDELHKSWIAPAGETWLKRYMANPLAKVN